MLPLVAIVGRPNVGKSTLFNRIVGGRPALVADEPGLTRDRHYGEAVHDGRRFGVVDTGGFEPTADSGIEALVAAQTRLAIDEADVILFVCDARSGLTSIDEHVAESLRRSVHPVICAANKVDSPKQHAQIGEFYSLGAKQVFPISAAHGLGVQDLLDEIVAHLPKAPAGDSHEQPAPAPQEREASSSAAPRRRADDPDTRMALIGRPNSGKSALLNRLVGAERAIVSDVPGTTRDPVDARIATPHGIFTIVDTAGIRRKRRAGEPLERLAAFWSARRIAEADVACLVIDAKERPTVQDAKLAALTLDAGRGLVIVLSKSDLLGSLSAARKQLRIDLSERLPFADFAPQIFLSSVTGAGVGRLLPAVGRVLRSWNFRVPTAELNRFLQRAVADHAPPSSRGRPVRLQYVSQPQSRPPTFVIHTNRPEGVPEAYRRYLVNRLRESFGFEGVPLRILFRASKRERSTPGRRKS